MAKPKLPFVINPQGKPVTKEMHPYVTIQPPSHLDDDTKRFLTQIQQHASDASAPSRHVTPYGTMQAQTLIKGVPYPVRHGLGVAFSAYHVTRTYATYVDPTTKQPTASSPWSVVEVATNDPAWPSGVPKDQTQYLVLMPSASGCYDIRVEGG